MTATVDFDRDRMLRRLADEDLDVLVVGAGITGVGVALDAVTRGLRVAVIDKGDLASGTSSKSSKLVHGGLRYLQQREYRLVYEALAERQRLRRAAPHLVRTLPFMIPIFSKDGLINPKVARALGTAMWMYDLTGGARIGRIHERLERTEALAHMPTLPAERLAAAYLYFDARADDARLVLTVARTAAAHGAVVATYCRLTGLRKDRSGRVTGAVVEADGHPIEVRARCVVNAAGVWADDVRSLDEGTRVETIRPARGIHITVPWAKVRNDIAVVIPVPKDRRSLFLVPWGELAFIGTTDTDDDGPLDDPQCTRADIDYVLRAANASLTTPLTERDVLGTWAGLRPLVRRASSAKTADLSRRHIVDRSASGVVTVAGGKLTTFRQMAADTVDEVCHLLGVRARCRTTRLPLLGAEGYVHGDADDHLGGRYGSEAGAVRALCAQDPSLAAPLVPGLPYLRAEAVHAARHEMAVTLDDVLSRRTRARLLLRDASAAAAADVARLLAPELGWSAAEAERQAADYRAAVASERSRPELPETALEASLGA